MITDAIVLSFKNCGCGDLKKCGRNDSSEDFFLKLFGKKRYDDDWLQKNRDFN